jgi:hypothetical protein
MEGKALPGRAELQTATGEERVKCCGRRFPGSRREDFFEYYLKLRVFAGSHEGLAGRLLPKFIC